MPLLHNFFFLYKYFIKKNLKAKMVQLKMVEQNTQEKKKVLNVSSKDPWKKKLKKVQRDTKESKKKKKF